MKYYLLAVALLLIACFTIAQDSSARLLYADFEKLSRENRPISNRDGQIVFDSNAPNPASKPKINPRMFGAQAPLTQRLGFEFDIPQNPWAEASMKVIGMKDKGRLDDWAKTLLVKSEDVTGYKNLSLDLGAAGVTQLRLRVISEGNGVDAGGAHPEKIVTVTSSLQNYKIALADFKQPTGDWVTKKVTTEQVLKKLTGIQISVTQAPSKGIVITDNIAFEK